ncbi:hypothetical protein [Thiorhodospira sibirica]|uniref:hypothetical protein n=1 Tax=Thiorhodospira sibirica TaxID=154347 RepID=UPI000A03362B|nr:hypothetical protein [Thiorhodospira sibirica]
MAVTFVVCLQVDNLGDVSGDDLHVGRLYEVVEQDAGHGMMRIIDESGEDYLYPAACFATVSMQDNVATRLLQVLPHN